MSAVRSFDSKDSPASDDKPDHNHEPDGDEEDESANDLIAGEAHRRKWHGRPARDATRRMRVPP